MYLLFTTMTELTFYQLGLLLKYIVTITLTILPIIIIIKATIDVFKYMMNPDKVGNTIKTVANRIIAAWIIFLIPSVVKYTCTLINDFDSDFLTKYYTKATVEKVEELKEQRNKEIIAAANKDKAELKEATLKKAEEQRKKIEQAEAKKLEEEQNNSGNYSGDSVSNGTFGGVKVENGVFYIPNKRATSDADTPKQSGSYGLNPIFSERLDAFLKDAAANGYKITVTSSWRSYSSQKRLWDQSNRSCSTRSKWVACPGGSRHGFGIAADLSFNGTSCSGSWDCNSAAKWAHANAAKYGLKFRMSWEPWHIEPEQVNGGNFGSCNVAC